MQAIDSFMQVIASLLQKIQVLFKSLIKYRYTESPIDTYISEFPREVVVVQ